MLDGALLDGYTAFARLYQGVTGEHKDRLTQNAYAASSLGFGVSIPIYLPLSSLSLPLLFYSALSYLNCKTKFQLAETLPYSDSKRVDNILPLFFLGSLYFSIKNGLDIFAKIENRDASELNFKIFSFLYGLSSLALASSVYMERVNIEPPSGKSILERIGEYLNGSNKTPVKALVDV